ncbi:MarR family winged helix-turn-helix transcriptional regulator [Saccharothrix violaceirubra]|uniref:DNA-binding MarR family transcriptional regulator n=1 Tax=Saccharothrix violaceirubra TaxID=413306 RepID=A0A7W7WX25_9PSEU|nr:MarR family transcriptional regulator [Saccharothrix violaceirubra]MBB4966965.1 DNA-binding MarR family transcriptional regulator [Saccharothrix violaceirubra]
MADRLGFTLARLGLSVSARLHTAMAVTGLKPRQCLAVMRLAEGPLNQLDLARELDVDPSVLVAVLNDLENRDLATRRRAPEDRRRHIVEITERGRAVVADLHHAIDTVEHDLFADLAPADLTRLAGLLDRLGKTEDAPCSED